MFSSPMLFFGLDVIVSRNLDDTRTKQVRFPRSKKKRIKKKWRRDPGNWITYRVPVGYRMGNRLIVNDLQMFEIRKQIALFKQVRK